VGGPLRKSLYKRRLGYPHPHNAFLARCVRKVLSKRLLDYPHPFAPFGPPSPTDWPPHWPNKSGGGGGAPNRPGPPQIAPAQRGRLRGAPRPRFFHFSTVGVENKGVFRREHVRLCAYLYRMVWLSPKQVREVVREVMGWKMHPKTLCAWSRAGKLRGYSPGGRRVFYRIEEVAALVGLTPDQVAAIVQKEKGGRP